MTDKELIQAYRECSRHPRCEGCPMDTTEREKDCPVSWFDPDDMVNRMEALLAENERLKAQLPKWRPASEPPEEYRDEYGELKCFLVCVENVGKPFRAVFDGKHWGDGWNVVAVTHWMPLPSTEGVE